ncbi:MULTISPECIES: DUF3106 domain-containing protein [Mycetohabitans]|uniref:DUF3106 domain-containing protein n=1 Tax=Mycetohabitans TaxID=2571159 RepID=UPI001F41CBF2|nr:DUF3106 domain-containing protein [Mycetohabitans sp. B3]
MSNKRGLAMVYAGVMAAFVAFMATYPRFHPASSSRALPSDAAPAPVGSGVAAVASHAAVADMAADAANPLSWARLTAAQRDALAPLAPQWDHFSAERKRKWLKIAARYPKMRTEEQQRLHQRMAEWIRMTPQQRRVARENYQLSKELSVQAREKAWSAYQQLPDELKRKLAATEKARRPTVVSAPPSGKPEIKDLGKLERSRERADAAAAAPRAGTSASTAPVGPGTPPDTHPAPSASAAALTSSPAAGSQTEPEKPAQSVPWFFNDHAQ